MKKKSLEIFHAIQLFLALKNNTKELFIYDIDNTIADTWKFIPSGGGKISNKIFSTLPIFPGFADILRSKFATPNCEILFFTVRPITAWFTTIRWLQKNGFPVKWHDVFLFTNPAHKIDLLSSISKSELNVTFVDDLSYNHENGNVKFFMEEIERLKNINVTYINVDMITKIQKNI